MEKVQIKSTLILSITMVTTSTLPTPARQKPKIVVYICIAWWFNLNFDFQPILSFDWAYLLWAKKLKLNVFAGPSPLRRLNGCVLLLVRSMISRFLLRSSYRNFNGSTSKRAASQCWMYGFIGTKYNGSVTSEEKENFVE